MRKLTKNDSMSIRLGGVYLELAKVMECFGAVLKLMNEIEEIITDEKSAVDEGGKD